MPTTIEPSSLVTRRARKANADRKKGLLIVPEFPYDTFWSYRYVLRLIGRKAAFPPLGLLTFAGYLPDDWNLELIDLNVCSPSGRTLRKKIGEADAVFVSAMSIQKKSLVDLLGGPARDTDTPFVLGGSFASSYRDQILDPRSDSDRILSEGLDVLVWGEAYASIEELLDWLDSGPVHDSGSPRLLIPGVVKEVEPGSRRYLNDRSIFRPLDTVPLPRWDLLRVKDYQSLMIQTTAGCPFRCDFCDIIQFNGGFNRPKSPATVRRELTAILDTGFRGSVFGVDDNFIGMPTATDAILDAMIEFQREHGYPFSFFTQASVNLGSPKLAHLIGQMKRAGFESVFLGVENPDKDALRGMNKKQNIKVDVPEAISRIQSAGIEVYAGFIFGTDGDTPSTGDRIVEFVRSTRIFTAMTGMLTPIPHTPLYERLRAEGRLLPVEFSGNNTDDEVQFEPSGMTPVELREGIYSVLDRLFSRAEAYRRAGDMLEAVRPHIFSRKRVQLRYLKAAIRSFWRQGILKLDRRYFGLLWGAFLLDWRLSRRLKKNIHRLKDRLARVGTSNVVGSWDDREWMEELLGLAHDHLVRFRPEEKLEQVREWIAETRARLDLGFLSATDARKVYDGAARSLRVRLRQHRFPGISLARAFEAAIKGLHYETVTRSIVKRGSRSIPE